MKLAPYLNYKTTEALWLGDVPSHWEVRRLRTVLRLRKEKNSPVKTEQILSLSIARGVTLYSHEGRGGNKRKGDITAYNIAKAGDIVLNSMNVIVGAVGLSRYTGAISPVYYALFPATDEVDIKYYDKVFGNTAFQRYLLIYGKGILIKKSNTGKLNTIRMKISPDDLKGTLLPVPPKDEQQQIARFLDWETTQINKFIRNKRRLIELLKEQKQNVINQAVTRGLDPNVKLKPSAVEWIGDIPEHWEEIPLKQIARADNSGSYGVEPELGEVVLPVATTAQIDKDGRFLVKKMPIRGFTEAEAKRYSCKPGEILVVKSSGSISNVITGKAGILTDDTPDFAFSNFLMRLTAKREKVLPLYLFYLLTSHLTRERVKRMVAGSTYPNLRVGEYLSSKLPLPEIVKQSAICDFIRSETSVIDQAITRAEREIELMREYRTQLISDVVTGQVDVRGIEVPEVAEEELLVLEEDTAESEEGIDDEGDMDETGGQNPKK